MSNGTVLVIGNSGVGKSTLINAVLGEEVAITNWGTEGTTKELKIYGDDKDPFRIIDTVGFEPSYIKEHQAINAVRKWSKQSAEEGQEERIINTIWFCVDGTSRKLFEKSIKNLSMATKMWETVPIVVVITKSYSQLEREENIEMVHNAFSKQKISKNLKRVIPVVASTYQINDTMFASPEGITDLIDITNELMPEGIKAAKADIYKFKLSRKNALAQGIISGATIGGVVVGAVSIPFADAVILTPVEVGLVNALASMYEIGKSENAHKFINSIIEVGTVSAAAKTALSAIKAIPGLNVAGAVLNAIVAGVFVATIGETSKYLFEQVYTGEKSIDDIDWAKKITEAKLTNEAVDKFNKVINEIDGKYDKDSVVKAIKKVFL